MRSTAKTILIQTQGLHKMFPYSVFFQLLPLILTEQVLTHSNLSKVYFHF